MRIAEERLIKNYKNYGLYINTSGYAFIKFWTDQTKKYFFPNNNGYVFIKGKKVNLKRLIYKAVYPNLSLKGKVVFKAKGNIFSIQNLFMLSKNEFVNYKKYNYSLNKDENTGIVTSSK